MQMMNFIDVRLRPNVHVQPEEVEAYYRTQVLPDLEKAGGQGRDLAGGRAEESANCWCSSTWTSCWMRGCTTCGSRRRFRVRCRCRRWRHRRHTRRLAESSMTENAPVRKTRFPLWFWAVMAGLFAVLVVAIGLVSAQRRHSRRWCGTAWSPSSRKPPAARWSWSRCTGTYRSWRSRPRDLTIHGLEPAGEVPLAHADRLLRSAARGFVH